VLRPVNRKKYVLVTAFETISLPLKTTKKPEKAGQNLKFPRKAAAPHSSHIHRPSLASGSWVKFRPEGRGRQTSSRAIAVRDGSLTDQTLEGIVPVRSGD
jgi:hypothetical protein